MYISNAFDNAIRDERIYRKKQNIKEINNILLNMPQNQIDLILKLVKEIKK